NIGPTTLEQRMELHRDQEAFHARQEVHHREQRAIHAAELEKVRQSLEAFRGVATVAVDLAKPLPTRSTLTSEEEDLPAPGRLMVGRLVRLAVQSPSLAEPFGPTAVTGEANRRFANRLSKPVDRRMVSNVLRRMLA